MEGKKQNKASGSSSGNDRGVINVLIARFSALGDVAMCVPVVYSVCRCYPDVRFVLVTRPTMTPIFINPPENLVLVGADVKNDYTGIGGIRRLVSELTAEYSIDAFIDLHNVLRTKLMGLFCRLKGIRVYRLYKAKSKRRALTRRQNKVMLPMVSQRARYREAFFKAGLPITERFDGLYQGRSSADPALFEAISAPKQQEERWIGIAPFAAHKGKIYPPEKMEEVLARLCAAPESAQTIFLFGGGDHEREILDGWAKKYPGVVSLAGKKYGFPAELALINHLDLMVTMDSANMHLAAIAGTPALSIWGATHPYCGFKGWRQRDSDTVQLPVSCRPCSVFGNKPCHRGDYLCLTAIRPDQIYKKIIEHLKVKS